MASLIPGRLIDLDTHRLHLRCEGEGSPVVVFDAALGASSLSWSLVQPPVARITAACSYDRAGFGQSDAGPLPRTADRIADELFALLARAAIPPPYVLVGHSYGGLVMRLFAARHPGTVAGLVLVEPAVPDEWADPSVDRRALIAKGTRLCGYGTMAARYGFARLVAGLVQLGALAPARALVALISRGGLRREDEGILAPIWKLPPETRATLRHAWTQPKFFEALGSQIETICDSARTVLRERLDFGDLPLVVITGSSASTGRRQADEALARLSTRGRHVVAPDSGHWVPLDSPRSVIDEIGGMVEQVRGSIPGTAR